MDRWFKTQDDAEFWEIVSAAVASPRTRTHQKEHAVAPALEKRFDPQTWQTALEVAARTSEKEPALQSVHVDSEAAACWSPYLPAGQSKHRSVREQRPHTCVSTKHRCDTTGDTRASCLTHRGILRLRHFRTSLPDKAHRQWMLASSICMRVRTCIFGWQNIDVHGMNECIAPSDSEYVPTTQVMQVKGESPPTAIEYFPAAHETQLSRVVEPRISEYFASGHAMHATSEVAPI